EYFFHPIRTETCYYKSTYRRKRRPTRRGRRSSGQERAVRVQDGSLILGFIPGRSSQAPLSQRKARGDRMLGLVKGPLFLDRGRQPEAGLLPSVQASKRRARSSYEIESAREDGRKAGRPGRRDQTASVP